MIKLLNENMKLNLSKIKEQIAEGNLNIAIKDFQSILKDLKNKVRIENYQEIEKAVISLSANIKDLNKKEQSATLDFNEFKITYNQILIRLLNVVNQTEELISKGKKSFFEDELKNLIFITPKRATELAIEKVKNGQSMKVIGIGRQNFAQISKNNHVIEYYDAIEKRLKEKPVTNIPFYVKRITQHTLESRFQQHLRDCFDITEQFDSKYEIIFYGDLRITYTYHIINSVEQGNATLFLTLNTKDTRVELVDNTLAFYTENKSIIEKFNQHFDQFWTSEEGQKGRIARNLTDFEHYVPFKPKIYSRYCEIKRFIKRIPNDSVRIKHLDREIKIFYRRLEGLNNSVLEVSHSRKNQRLSDCFTDYMIDLKKGNKSYKTVSLRKFWEEIYDMRDFLEKQEDALQHGAIIERIYLVDYDQEANASQTKTEGIAILRNYIQHQNHENYNFKILFSSYEDEVIRRKNYAIWEDKDISYKVLFSFNYRSDGKGVTELTFADFKNDSSV